MNIVKEFKEAIKITGGVRPDKDSEFIVDMRDDYKSDLINSVISSELYFSKFRDNAYYFGYSFNESASRNDRARFIEWLKTQAKITNQIREFINRPLIRLERMGVIDNIELVVYPDDRENRLVRLIIESLYSVVKGANFESVTAIKNTPSEIGVDYNALRATSRDDYQYKARKEVVDDLLNKIHSLEYFSLAKNVYTKYRPYITNYLKFNSEEARILSSIEDGNVLIVDDINTSGSTLNEVINQIHKINKDCKIYIFTLIGK